MSKKLWLSGFVALLTVFSVQKAQAQNVCPIAAPNAVGVNINFNAQPCAGVCQFVPGPNEIICQGTGNDDYLVAVSNPNTQFVYIWGWLETAPGVFQDFCCDSADPGMNLVRPLVVNAGPGDDIIYLTDPLAPFVYHHDSTLFGGDGTDIIHGSDDGNFIDTVEAGNGGTVAIPQRVYGYRGNDQIFGGNGVDHLHGDNGHDTIEGGDGDDFIYGHNGRDTIYGGFGDDVIYGDTGIDDLYGDEGDDWIEGGDQDDDIDGGEGNDDIYGGDGVDTIYGGPWTTNPDDDCIFGEGGDDYIDGRAGNDGLHGGDDSDTLLGNSDDDFMCGAGDVDYLFPNTGTDYCSEETQDFLTGTCIWITQSECENAIVANLGCILP